LEQTAWP